MLNVNLKKKEATVGFEPTNIGFANRRQENINNGNKETYAQGKTALSPTLSTDGAPKAQNTPEIDPDLKAIISAWDNLPEHIRQAIKSLADIPK
jgi:hypothetical protein